MESNSEAELRKELEATRKRLHSEQLRREAERADAEARTWAREQKASNNTAALIFFGSIGLIFLLLILANGK
jgi:5-formyltetrahydrofolate cyclo-ligase